MKIRARTAVARGKESPLTGLGSDLRLGREEEKEVYTRDIFLANESKSRRTNGLN